MRLAALDGGHAASARLFLRSVGLMSRIPMPDVVVALLYRPELGGGPLLDLASVTMRGESYWSPAEREALALATARGHRCPYCVDIHTELVTVASGQGHGATDRPARPQLRAMEQVIESVYSPTGDVGAAIVAASAVPTPREAIDQALTVHLVWDVVNRMAHAYGFELAKGQLKVGTRALHLLKYRMPAFLTGPITPRPSSEGLGRFDAHVDALRSAPLETGGHTPRPLRAAAMQGDELPEPWTLYGAHLRQAPYKVTDEHVQSLKSAGVSDDEIIEVTTAVAVGAALRVFDEARRELVASSS